MKINQTLRIILSFTLVQALFIAESFSVFGQQKRNVAVLTLEVSAGIPATYSHALTDRLRHELFNTGAFNVMERGEMDEILSEIGFQQTGCTSDECVIQAGKILGVNNMIAGSVNRFDRLYTITLRIISVSTSQIEKSIVVDHMGTIEEVITMKMQEGALKLADLYTGGTVTPGLVSSEGTINLTSIPPGGQVFVDRKDTKLKTPVNLVVSSGSHNIKVINGDKVGQEQVFVTPNRTIPLNIELKTGYGSLNLNSTPPGAFVYLDSLFIGETPIKKDSLLAGNYNLDIRKEGYGGHKEDIKINLEQQFTKTIDLKKLASLQIVSRPANAEIFLNDSLMGKTPWKKSNLNPGQYELKIVKAGFLDFSEKFELNLEDSLSKEIDLVQLANIAITSVPGEAGFYLNTIYQGVTPYNLTQLSPGNYNIKLTRKKYQTLKTTINITEGSIQTFNYNLIPKNRSTALILSAFIPGAGQIYGERKTVGWGIMGLQIASGVMAFNYAGQHTDKVAEYNEARLLYNESTTQWDIDNNWDNMNSLYDETESLKTSRDIFITVAAAVYIYNLVDVGLLTKFLSADNAKLGTKFDENNGNAQISLTIEF